jgi:hypothetical protein
MSSGAGPAGPRQAFFTPEQRVQRVIEKYDISEEHVQKLRQVMDGMNPHEKMVLARRFESHEDSPEVLEETLERWWEVTPHK